MTAPSSRPDSRTAREQATDLQIRANALVSRTDLHCVISVTDHGWVEIQADYLDALLAEVERLEGERDEAYRQAAQADEANVMMGELARRRLEALRQAVAEIGRAPYQNEAWGWGIAYRIDEWRAVADGGQENPA